jgi:AcrR family transcriptional regulator
MARPKIVEGEIQTSDRLLSAAERSFAEAGFDGAKLHDIAEAAGISRPSLLYHFESKHALYCAVVQRVFADLGESIREGLTAEGGFGTKLDAVLTNFVRFLEARPTAARLVLREVLDGRGPGHDLLLSAGVPLLRLVERFIRDKGRGFVPEGVPVEDALLQLVAGSFVKAAATGSLKAELWGPIDRTPAIARVLFLGGNA